MRKNKLIQVLSVSVLIAVIVSVGILSFLVEVNQKFGERSAENLGNLYMSEMMLQLQEHFETVITIKNKETSHIIDHTRLTEDVSKEALAISAESMSFEYLALYDVEGNYETLLGEDAWYRDFPTFVEKVLDGENTATTGYQTRSGEKYVVFGVPAEYEMKMGRTSSVLVAGIPIDRLYEYIKLNELERLGSKVKLEIVLTNGAYIIGGESGEEENFFDFIQNSGEFSGVKEMLTMDKIEEAMSAKDAFFGMLTIEGEINHIYGDSIGAPTDWYFIISMSEGVTDNVLQAQTETMMNSSFMAGTVILLLFILVFVLYFQLSMKQIKETELAKADAEVANKAKSTFLSNMSHDIRTPMNAVVGFAAIVEESIKAGDTQKALESIEKMKKSSDYMRQLISDVLDMSKIESGTLALVPETVSLKELLDIVATIARENAATREQDFRIQVYDILEDRILCDHVRMNQILMNLLGNASKFTPKGGKIELEVYQEESRRGDAFIKTIFIVKDNGIGMSENFLNMMFESFAREESRVRKIEGTGLGLTIVKSLIEMMNGDIVVESKEGAGATFRVIMEFPVVASRYESPDIAKTELSVEGMHILLAEDNDLNYEIAEALLSANGLLVERAENGAEAVRMYEKDPAAWDFILMDLRMPVLNGYEATEKIRQHEREIGKNKGIPIYALSADVFAEDIAKCKGCGMEGHISKPIDMTELLYILRLYRERETLAQ